MQSQDACSVYGKDFTWYPHDMREKFSRVRAPWTYMTDAERKLPAFQRPKKWFPKKDWARVKKVKVFGMTTSNGKKLCIPVPLPWDAAAWADVVTHKVAPFLRRSFPRRSRFQILLDGESVLHAPGPKRAMEAAGITVLPNWPKYSPDLNPQENVWAWAEERLREIERPHDTFQQFKERVITAVEAYPHGGLIASMAGRIKTLLARGGANVGK